MRTLPRQNRYEHQRMYGRPPIPRPRKHGQIGLAHVYSKWYITDRRDGASPAIIPDTVQTSHGEPLAGSNTGILRASTAAAFTVVVLAQVDVSSL